MRPTDSQLRAALAPMILSVSGWRKIFAPDGEHGSGAVPSEPDQLLAAGMGLSWGTWLSANQGIQAPQVLVATDTRPTGAVLAEMLMRGLEASGAAVHYPGVAASPEIMARSGRDHRIDAFAYISASHNPLGHNGVKFGIGGGVLGGCDAASLLADFRNLIDLPGAAEKLFRCAGEAFPAEGRRRISGAEKRDCLRYYREFLEEVAGGPGTEAEREATVKALRAAIARHPIGVVADLNGSARCGSADRAYLEGLGVKCTVINGKAGEIVHEILPEGQALVPCRDALVAARREDPAALIGYVPDNDGDRGNLVVWDNDAGDARILEAQEVFALSALAELASEAWSGRAAADTAADTAGSRSTPGGRSKPDGTGSRPTGPAALVVNGPTSHRIRDIADAFETEVFEAEVGEANVVNCAAELKRSGRRIRFLGEGSNGGTIIHPAKVRDPLTMVTAILKLLRLPSSPGNPGPFEDWCRRIGSAPPRASFGISEILASLPVFTTTPASAERAKMTIRTRNHGDLKAAWEGLFRRQWSLYKEGLGENYGFVGWFEVNNEGTGSRRGMGGSVRSGAESGGLKVVFQDAQGRDAGFLWMRGSGTEPVFRVMAEIRGDKPEAERALTAWHRGMIAAADGADAQHRKRLEPGIPSPIPL